MKEETREFQNGKYTILNMPGKVRIYDECQNLIYELLNYTYLKKGINSCKNNFDTLVFFKGIGNTLLCFNCDLKREYIIFGDKLIKYAYDMIITYDSRNKLYYIYQNIIESEFCDFCTFSGQLGFLCDTSDNTYYKGLVVGTSMNNNKYDYEFIFDNKRHIYSSYVSFRYAFSKKYKRGYKHFFIAREDEKHYNLIDQYAKIYCSLDIDFNASLSWDIVELFDLNGMFIKAIKLSNEY